MGAAEETPGRLPWRRRSLLPTSAASDVRMQNSTRAYRGIKLLHSYGQQRIKCPQCGGRNNTLSVNSDRGLYHCVRCGWSWPAFGRRSMGEVEFIDAIAATDTVPPEEFIADDELQPFSSSGRRGRRAGP